MIWKPSRYDCLMKEILLLLIFTGIVLRIAFPLADPPAQLSWSGGYFADEGFWVHDARNIMLTDSLGGDEWHNRLVSPISHLLSLTAFHLFPPSLFAVRMIAQSLSLCSVVLLWVCVRKESWGLLATCLFSTSSLLIAYQRIAILETQVIPVLLSGFLVWQIANRKNIPILDYFVGVTASLGYLTKGTQWFFPFVVLIATALSSGSARPKIRRILWQISGLFSAGLAYWFLVFSPFQTSILQYQSFYKSQHGESILDLVKNFASQPFFFYYNRIPLILSVFWLAIIELSLSIASKKSNWYKIPDSIRFCFIWAIWGLLSLSPLGYRPLRYYIPVLIPMVCIAAWRIHSTFVEADVIALRSKKRRRVIMGVWMSLPILAGIFPFIDHLFFQDQILRLFSIPGYSIAWSSLSIGLGCLFSFVGLSRPGTRTKLVLAICVTSVISADLFQSVYWHRHRQYSIVTSARDLATVLPPGSVVAGQWAPELCLESTFIAIPIWKGFVNWNEPFEKYGITHILSWEYPLGNELVLQRQWFPDKMKETKEIKRYVIKNTPVILWKVNNDPAR